jgi:hypothetical protein
MTKLFMGIEEGYGPVLKVMADPADDPDSTPDTEYDKFRFNSKTADATPILWTSTKSPNGADGPYKRTFDLPGSLENGQTPCYDIFLTDGNGWNYPNFWASERFGGANFWGTFANPRHTNHGSGVTFQVDSLRYSSIASGALSLNDYDITLIAFDVPATGKSGPTYSLYTPTTYESRFDLKWDDPVPVTSGKKFFRASSAGVKLARPGYDIDTAAASELILGGNVNPAIVYFTKRFTITGNSTETFDLADDVPDNAVCLMQWNASGGTRLLPSFRVGSTGTGVVREIRWKVSAGQLIVENLLSGSLDVILILMSRGDHPTTGGGKRVQAGIDSNGVNYTRIFGQDDKLLLDTRYSYLPIIDRHEEMSWKKNNGERPGWTNNSSVGLSKSFSFLEQSYIPFVLCYRDFFIYNNPAQGGGTSQGFAEIHQEAPRYHVTTTNAVIPQSWTVSVTNNSLSYQDYYRTQYRYNDFIGNSGYPLEDCYFAYYIFGVPSFD